MFNVRDSLVCLHKADQRSGDTIMVGKSKIPRFFIFYFSKKKYIYIYI